MTDITQKVIRRFFDRIEDELNAHGISGKLFSRDVIDFSLKENISKGTTKDANIVLANYLYQNADRAKLECFLTVLVEPNETHPRHQTLATDMRVFLAQLSSKGRGSPEQALQPSQLGRDQPAWLPSSGQVSMNNTCKDFDEQPGSLFIRPAEDRGLHKEEQQPDSSDDLEQNDKPEVDPGFSKNVEVTCIDDAVAPEPDDDEAHLAEGQILEEPEPDSTAKKKCSPKKYVSGNTPTKESNENTREASLRMTPTKKYPYAASSFNIVCYFCHCELSYWNCIRSSRSCQASVHKKDYFVLYDGCVCRIREPIKDYHEQYICRDSFNCRSGLHCKYAHCEEELSYWRDQSVLPPYEVCKDCRWECCLSLFRYQCWTPAHNAIMAEVVVFKNEMQKNLIEIRCPMNYLSMRNKVYRGNHPENECRHRPVYTCRFPHYQVEEDIWNKWKETASVNVCNRTATQFLAEIRKALKPVSLSGITLLPSPQRGKAAEPKKTRPPLSAEYKGNFQKLNHLEEEAHVKALDSYTQSFSFTEYVPNNRYDRNWKDKPANSHGWYGALSVPQYLGNHVCQAATHVELEKEGGGGWQLTGNIIHTDKFLSGKYILLVGFAKGTKKPRELTAPHYDPDLRVKTSFTLKYRYFGNLRNAIRKLPEEVVPKLMPERLEAPECSRFSKAADVLTNLPEGFKLDKEYQEQACIRLFSSSPNVPFLITGPFGTGKTRVIATAAYCLLKAYPESRILIATHHLRTADEYVKSYFTEEVVARQRFKVVRLVNNDTSSAKLNGLTKNFWMVNDTVHEFQLIITTFIMSMGLSRRLKAGHFSHIFIDEGAQAREPETIAAFSVAGRDTKIIIAGDHMQVGPKTSVLGDEPRNKGLSDSLLVRLRNRYKTLSGAASQAHQSELLINYRCHPAIVRLPSKLFYGCNIQTRAKSVPHPDWEKMVYFVCSSLDTKQASGSEWSTQTELLEEAKCEIQVLIPLIQEYIHKQSKGNPSLTKTVPDAALPDRDLSICVMFPTRLTETLWKRDVHDLPDLRKVERDVTYDIQGREFDAIFVCTAQPVKEDYSPFDPVKSMCDPYMFNTIITRPKSLIVVIGNPFRLRKIEETTPDFPACWSEYLYQCWEGGSLLLSARLRDDLGACKKQLDELEGVMFQRAADKLRRVDHKTSGKEEGKDGEIDTIMPDHSGDSKATAVQTDGWKLGEAMQVPKGKHDSLTCTECKLDGYTAIPTDLGQKPVVIPGVDERRCAFDGATVVVEETEQRIAGRRTGKVVSIIWQGPVEPMICTVDPHSPLILTPVGGKNPKIVNLPTRTMEKNVPKPTKETAVEAVVNCYSHECPTRMVDAIPYTAAVDMFFIVQPLEWLVNERYPVGAVVGILPKCPPLRLTEEILAVQHKVSQSKNFIPGTPSSKDVASPPPLSSKPMFKTAIGIRDPAGNCNIAFSVEDKKNHFIMAVHVSNVMDHLSEMDEFKKKRFNEWSASHPILPQHVVQACDFTETPIQKAITVEFKVEDPMSTFDVAIRRNTVLAQLDVNLMSIHETVVQCSTMLGISDVEDILWSLQKGRAADRKLIRGKTLCLHDTLAILYCTAEHLHKTRHGHGGYPLLEMASYEFPETEKMVNELLTRANSEAAKMIAKAFPDRALMVTQTMPDHSKEEIAKEFSSSLTLLPTNYPWLTAQGHARSQPVRPFTLFTRTLKEILESLKTVDFLKAHQLLYFLHYHPQFAPMQEAVRSSMTAEYFSVGNSSPTHFLRHVPYTSITDPFRCVGDVYVQEQLLAAVKEQELQRCIPELQEVAMHCNRARLNAKDYESARSKLKWAHFAQNFSICVQSIVRSMEGGKLHLCCQYDQHGNIQENITVPVLGSKDLHADYTAIVTSLMGPCQVTTRSEYQGGSDSILVQAYGKSGVVLGDASCSLLMTPRTVQVPADTLRTVVNCITTFDEEKAAKALKSLQQLGKQEHKSPNRRGPPAEPEVLDALFLLLESPFPLSPHQVVDLWMQMDISQFIATPQPQLLEVGHSNVRVCLHHTEQPEACFTGGSNMQAPQQVHSSVESYVSEWEEVLLAEAVCRSIGRKRHILINDVRIRFNKFEALDMFASEQFYLPVGEITALLPRVFMEDRQDIFPLEQGDLVCARYEVDLTEDDAGLELLARHGNCFPPQHEPVGRLVLHMVVERVAMEGTQQEVMMSQEVVQSGVEVYLRVVGEQGAHISPLMRDLLVTNKHTCQMEVVPMEPKLRRVYQNLKALGRLVKPSELGKDIIFGDISRFKSTQVPDRPTFIELEKENRRVAHLWRENLNAGLNAGQMAAIEKAYQSRFHIIQGPPGTAKLVVAVHLAYAFAQKNKQMGLRKATGMQHCVLLCAPDDAAVDTTLSLLEIVAGSSEKDIRLLRIYSREVERKHCPGPYQDTNVFEDSVTVDYRVPQEVEKFALHNLINKKMVLPSELEEIIKYSNIKMPSPAQRSKYRQSVAEAERRVIQEGQFDVVLCTCSEASSARVQRHFSPFQCIVYEASLATEPETVAAIARSSHQVVLIGDHSSVCPPVCSQRAGLAGLGVSLFERYACQLTEEDEYGLYSFLEEQYWMVEPLCEFPSREIYNGQLKTSSTLKCYNYRGLDLFWPKGNRQPLVFCNVRGREETEQLKSAEDAIVNTVEAEKVVDIVQKVVTALSGGKGKLTKETLAVLTTTEAQKSLIQGLLLQTDMDKTVMGLVRSQVMTISASRGAKANIVILSTTRSCPTGAIPKDRTALLDHQWKEEHLGLLCQPHHTCLALTTGKHGLVIVGDMDLLSLDDKWCHLVKHCSDKGCLVEGNAFPSQQFIESQQQAKEGKHRK